MNPDPPRRPLRRSAIVVLMVIAASAVVAVAATGVGLLLPPSQLDDGGLRAVRIGGGIAALVGLGGLLLLRKRLRTGGGRVPDPRDRSPDPGGQALMTAAKIMVVVALVALLAPRVAIEEGIGPGEGVGEVRIDPEAEGGPELPPPPTAGPLITEGFTDEGGFEDPDERIAPRGGGSSLQADGSDGSSGRILFLVLRILLLVLLAGVVVFGALALTRRLGQPRGDPEEDVPVDAADAEAGLEASLEEVAPAGSDPRGRIIAAYRRLLSALAAVGAPRRPEEAPHEHLRRALGPLGVRPEPMHRLAGLYVAARFSEHRITDEHRGAAAQALEEGLDDLRAATPRAAGDDAEPETLPAGRPGP